MKKFDTLFPLICGLLVAEVLREFGYFFYGSLFIILPFLSLSCFYLAEFLGIKRPFVFQAGKHILVGTFATIIDLKIFEVLFWLFSFFTNINAAFLKGFSFVFAIIIKYIGNKFWTFKKIENGISKKEFLGFFVTNSIGLAIDVFVFVFLTQILGPQFSLSVAVWRKFSVIISAIIAAIWNFCGDKFLVFKK